MTKLYDAQAWRHPKHGLRARTLAKALYCCSRCHRTDHSSRLHVHHVVPHHGDPGLFWSAANLVVLCAPCHDSLATPSERIGYSTELDSSGCPCDPRHPFNRR